MPVASAAAGRVAGGAAEVVLVVATVFVVVGFTSPTTVLSVFVSGAAAAPLAAQDPSSTAVIIDPQYVSYTLGSGSTARTISQLGIPFAVIVPFSDRFNIDISSSYANSQVKVPGSATSSISGLTDSQVRGNLTLGDNAAVITLGVNLPTGQYKVPDAQQAAAGQIGNDFLIYPVTSMGNGFRPSQAKRSTSIIPPQRKSSAKCRNWMARRRAGPSKPRAVRFLHGAREPRRSAPRFFAAGTT